MAEKVELSLAKRLRQLRKRYGVTQQEIAEKSGLDYKYYQTIEGKRPPNVSIQTLHRLAKAFGISLSKLLKA